MSFWKWSRTAANNANADPTCPFPEGMSPSAVNDGTRGMMAAAAKYRDDIAGANQTTGSATAYALASYQGFDTLAHLDGQQIAFVPHATNTGACTLNIDGLGAVPIRINHLTDLPSGTLIQGTPYSATYFAAANECILHLIGGNPYNVPLGGLLPYVGSTPPNSAFAFPYGQATLSRTVYSALFALVGTTFGAGDGSTTFGLPDLRGRMVAALDNMGGAPANVLTTSGSGISGTTIGATGGSETVALTSPNQLPPHTHGASVSDPGHVHQTDSRTAYFPGGPLANGLGVNSNFPVVSGGLYTTANQTGIGVTIGPTGSSAPHQNMPPTIVLPWLLRVI